MSLFGLDALASAANRVEPATVSMPLWYDKDRETEEEAKMVWDTELVAVSLLSELEVVNLMAHLENRTELGLREQRRREMERARLTGATVTPASGESSGSSSATVRRPSEEQLKALDEIRKKARLVDGILERERTAPGVAGVGVVVGDDWLANAAGRAKATAPEYVIDYDGKKRVGLSASDVEKGMLWMRLCGNLNGLSDGKGGITVDPLFRALRNRAEQASSALKVRALRVDWAEDSAQLADGALKELLELDICATRKKREMLVGMTRWEGSFTDFFRGTFRGTTEIEVALRTVDDVMEAVFGRRLGLFEPLKHGIRVRMLNLCLSPEYVVYTVNQMLDLFYCRMRGPSPKARFVDLSVEANWRESWQRIVEACDFTVGAMAEFNAGGERVNMRGGPLSPDPKYRDERRRDGGRTYSPPRDRTRLGGSPVRKLDWNRERSNERGRDGGRNPDRERDRTREDGDRGRPRDTKDESGVRGGSGRGDKDRVDGGGARPKGGVCVQHLASVLIKGSEKCAKGDHCRFTHEWKAKGKQKCMEAVDHCGKWGGGDREALKAAIGKAHFDK